MLAAAPPPQYASSERPIHREHAAPRSRIRQARWWSARAATRVGSTDAWSPHAALPLSHIDHERARSSVACPVHRPTRHQRSRSTQPYQSQVPNPTYSPHHRPRAIAPAPVSKTVRSRVSELDAAPGGAKVCQSADWYVRRNPGCSRRSGAGPNELCHGLANHDQLVQKAALRGD